LYKQGAWKVLTFRTVLEPFLFDTTLVNVTLFMMFRSIALSACAVATVTTFINEIVNACSTV